MSTSVYSCPHANVCTFTGLQQKDVKVINSSLSLKQVFFQISHRFSCAANKTKSHLWQTGDGEVIQTWC